MTDVNVEQTNNLASYIEQLGTPKTLEDAIRERDAWVESAVQFSRNEEYYTGLLDKIAASLGSDAYTSDDGSVYEDPVRAKLPELIAHRLTALSSAPGDVVLREVIADLLDLRECMLFGRAPAIPELETVTKARDILN